MKIIIGLGNPESRFERTRHNVGFEVVERLGRRWAPGQTWRYDFHSLLLELRHAQEPILLVKPQTYMNRSGLAVAELVQYYQLPLHHLLVICDDLNLPLGQLRLRAQGTHGGHKGLLDIQQRLGTTQYPRLRIGIGSPPAGWDAADFVLGRFRPEERAVIEPALERAADAVVVWLEQGIEAAMNRYNVRVSESAQGSQNSNAS
jgi:PTH1 family peptidyl-tRNA hydrolase